MSFHTYLPETQIQDGRGAVLAYERKIGGGDGRQSQWLIRGSVLLLMALAILVGDCVVTTADAKVNIEFVTVGNAGNAADTTGYGAVAYNYRIAKNETTIAQYCEFLNTVAKADPYGLWNVSMGNDSFTRGISRSGSSGSYTYSVMGDGERPITYVNWFHAARFCNWLHNGQGGGSTETGAYTLSGVPMVNPEAIVWIPSEDEWYKAAYHDPTKDQTGGYWLYPNRRNTMGGNSPGHAGSANYYQSSYDGAGRTTSVGTFGTNSASFYGTNDQAGNVWEWNDAVVGTSRGLRGGGWTSFESDLRSSLRNPSGVNGRYIGFRVAGKVLFTVSLGTSTNGEIAGAGDYVAGTSTLLTAIPAPGYLFTGWTGDATGTANPLSVLMDVDKTIGATFIPDINDDDSDGLTNYQEIVEYGTNPALPDTDGDGVNDKQDDRPLDPTETLDTDHDGIGDNADLDDDNDGLSDTDEITIHHTNPKRADSDGDGLTDPQEIDTHHTNPNLADTDNDGLKDGEEFTTYHTNPLVGDTDGDGFLDGYEVLTGKLPLDPLDKPALVADARTAIEFTFPAAIGKTYRIEASTDLAAWEIVESGIAGNGSQIQRFYSTRGQPKRYFRVEEDGP